VAVNLISDYVAVSLFVFVAKYGVKINAANAKKRAKAGKAKTSKKIRIKIFHICVSVRNLQLFCETTE
jgi:hypothetical protein